jgi:hypothetical protein
MDMSGFVGHMFLSLSRSPDLQISRYSVMFAMKMVAAAGTHLFDDVNIKASPYRML